MIGGDLSFASGGYNGTPVENILPVELSYVKPLTNPAEFHIKLSENGRYHPVMRLDDNPAQTEKIWAQLPPLAGANIVQGLKPNAQLLAVQPDIGDRSGNLPMVVAREVGKGRSLAIMTDSSWVLNVPFAAYQGSNRTYFKWYNNAIRWLIQDPEFRRVKITVDPTKENQDKNPGRRHLHVEVLDPNYIPLPEAELHLKIMQQPGNSLLFSQDGKTDRKGRFQSKFDLPASGFVAIEVEAESKDKRPIGTDEVILSAGQEQQEMQNPQIDKVLLQRLAAASGGEFRQISADSKLQLNRERLKAKSIFYKEKRYLPLWDRWFFFFLLIFLLGFEWFLRKRAGLM
jgi:hypothetical protein